MRSTGVLTTEDLDEIARSPNDQPLSVAADLVDAVDRGLVADQADTGYALMLAAEMSELAEDLRAAEVLAERAVEVYRAQGGPGSYPRTYRAELLFRLGREDEAMAEVTALRPALTEDSDAASGITEALEAGGHAEIAEHWLTEALVTALQRREAVESQESEPAQEQAMTMVFMLAMERHRIRRELDLPPDEHDDLAELLMETVDNALGLGERDFEVATLLFWPQPEFNRLLQRWPALAKELGHSWDDYRTEVQRTLTMWSEWGHPRLGLLAGSVDELAAYCDRHARDPADPQGRQDFIEHLSEDQQETPWPPSRNDPCWCGSALKYKKCCLPRTRA